MEPGEGLVLASSGLSQDEATAGFDILREAAFDARLIGDEADGYAIAVPADQLEDALAILQPHEDNPADAYRPDPLTAAFPMIVMGGALLVAVAATLVWKLVLQRDADSMPGAAWGLLIIGGLGGVSLLFTPLLSSPVRARAGAIQARKSKIVS